MCKDCKSSPMGIKRQAELDAAIEACKALNINSGTSGFIARHAWKGYTPQFKDEERTALDRYNAAQQAMKKLHEDFIFEGMRRYQEEMRSKGIKPRYIVHGDTRGA
jgi:hypothetical protein